MECPEGGGGGGGGTFYPGGGTVSPSAECPGGHCALVQNVRGDIPHGGTIHPPTPDVVFYVNNDVHHHLLRNHCSTYMYVTSLLTSSTGLSGR